MTDNMPPFVTLDPSLNSIQGIEIKPPSVPAPVVPPPAPVGEKELDAFIRKGSLPGRKTWSSHEFAAVPWNDLIKPVLKYGLDEAITPLIEQSKKHPELKLHDSPQLQLRMLAQHVM